MNDAAKPTFSFARYGAADQSCWNSFLERSKNGTFLLNRNYMDYHADRFDDHSLVVRRDGEMYALIPAV